MLDMGSPAKIAEVAHRLVEESHKPIEIVFTGLRPGEKLHEVLFGQDEPDVRPKHPMISHVPVPPMDLSQIPGIDLSADPTTICTGLRELCCAPGPRGNPLITQQASLAKPSTRTA